MKSKSFGISFFFLLHVQVLFACAEALYAHGYSNEACRLAVELARDLLANPPDLKVEQPQTKVNIETCVVQSETKYFKLSTAATGNYQRLVKKNGSPLTDSFLK